MALEVFHNDDVDVRDLREAPGWQCQWRTGNIMSKKIVQASPISGTDENLIESRLGRVRVRACRPVS